MFKLVVLSALLAFAAAAPHVAIGVAAPAAVAYSAPLVHSAPAVHAYSYAAAAPVVHHSSHVVHAAPVAYAAPAPVVRHAPVAYAAPAPVVHHAPIAYAAPAPVVHVAPVQTAITKTIHYESKPVVTGYTSSVIKPDLGHLHTPAEIVTQQRVLAPARSVQTITPQITQVEPEVSYQRVAVDVPVHTPVVSEVEVRTPTVVAPTAVHYSAPAVVHSAPAVHYNAAPAIAYGAHHGYAYGAHQAVAYGAHVPVAHYGAHVKNIASPAVAYSQW